MRLSRLITESPTLGLVSGRLVSRDSLAASLHQSYLASFHVLGLYAAAVLFGYPTSQGRLQALLFGL